MPFLIVVVTGRRVDPDGSSPDEKHFGMPAIERLSTCHIDAEGAKWLGRHVVDQFPEGHHRESLFVKIFDAIACTWANRTVPWIGPCPELFRLTV
jgi:hypothetical protein